MKFLVLTDRMKDLKKRMNSLMKKAEKYGCELKFEEGQTVYEKRSVGGKQITFCFTEVGAEGTVKNGEWEFVAVIDHLPDGNVIRCGTPDLEVPEKYFTAPSFCDHCNSRRYRKQTCLLYNHDTGEWKQVGKTCLRDYTGISLEAVLLIFDGLQAVQEAGNESLGGGYDGALETDVWLRYVAETIRHFGYTKANELPKPSTKNLALRFYNANHGVRDIEAKADMERCKFNPDSVETMEEVEAALEWLKKQDDSNLFLHNLKVVCASPFILPKHLGMAGGLFPSYYKGQKLEKEREVNAVSSWVGEVGKPVTVDVAEYRVLGQWDCGYGITSTLYRIVGKDGNVYVWKASRFITPDVKTLTGTVKEHNEYAGCKQTVLTRCRMA